MVTWERGIQQMRILQVTPYFDEHYGGTERYCFNLSKGLVERGHEVQVYTSRIKQTTPRREEKSNFEIHRFPTLMNVWNINPFSVITHRLVRNNFDIVHVHSYLYFNSNQAILAKILRSFMRRKTKLILHLHGGLGIPPYLDQQPIKKVVKRFYDATLGRLMMLGSDRILSACEADARAARKQFRIPREKLSLVYNAIDPTLFQETKGRGEKNDKPYLLYVGDLERWKGLRTLIKGMYALRARGEPFSLKLAGEGRMEDYLREQVDGIDVDFLGTVPHSQIPGLMKRAFAFILPSNWEGIPTVGLEAMAAKVPLIGTNVGGIPEIISNNITGLLISPNSPREIANAVLKLKDEAFRQTLTRNASKLVHEKFSIKSIVKQTEKIYEITLNS